MNQPWQREAAVLGGPDLLQVLLEIRDGQHKLAERVEGAEGAIERLLSGFPADDVDGHRRYHESVIEARELRNKLLRATLEKVVSSGVLIGLGWVMVAIWQWAKIEVTK